MMKELFCMLFLLVLYWLVDTLLVLRMLRAKCSGHHIISYPCKNGLNIDGFQDVFFQTKTPDIG